MFYSTSQVKLSANWLSGRALDSWSQGSEFDPCEDLRVVSLSKTLYSNLLLSTQVYNWVPAETETITVFLTLSKQHDLPCFKLLVSLQFVTSCYVIMAYIHNLNHVETKDYVIIFR